MQNPVWLNLQILLSIFNLVLPPAKLLQFDFWTGYHHWQMSHLTSLFILKFIMNVYFLFLFIPVHNLTILSYDAPCQIEWGKLNIVLFVEFWFGLVKHLNFFTFFSNIFNTYKGKNIFWIMLIKGIYCWKPFESHTTVQSLYGQHFHISDFSVSCFCPWFWFWWMCWWS